MDPVQEIALFREWAMAHMEAIGCPVLLAIVLGWCVLTMIFALLMMRDRLRKGRDE